jgi:sortase B
MARRQQEEHNVHKHREGSAFGTFLITLLLVIAIGVFVYSGWRLLGYYMAYKEGTDEYSALNEEFVNQAPEPVQVQPRETAQQGDTEGGDAGQGEGVSFDETKDQTPASGVFTSVTQLEDPKSLQEVLDGAYRESTVENGETKELPKLVNPVNFADLQSVNPEVIGWIRVGAVNISYPVAQAKDNEYYLHRTFKKVDNFAGCIFENCNNSPHFTDQNTIIYGHNMKNGSMFGQLKKYSEQETLDKNPYFWIFTKDYIYQYRIFSSSIVSKIGDPYIVRFAQEDFQKFIDKSIASSEIDCGDVKVTTKDRIVTLSTCTGNDATRRILQGVLVQVYLPA